MTDRTLLKQALDALLRGRPQIMGALVREDQDAAIAALRQALAQETTPAAWINERGDLLAHDPESYGREDEAWTPLYVAPPARRPLSETTLHSMWLQSPCDIVRFARHIERAHFITGGDE